MTPSEHARWANRRKLGRLGYILRHGILTKGIAFGLFMMAVQAIWLKLHGGVMPYTEWVIRFAAYSSLYGIINGWLDWSSEESRFAEGPETDELEPEVTCLKCESLIPANESRCPSCGWSFDDDGVPTEDA